MKRRILLLCATLLAYTLSYAQIEKQKAVSTPYHHSEVKKGSLNTRIMIRHNLSLEFAMTKGFATLTDFVYHYNADVKVLYNDNSIGAYHKEIPLSELEFEGEKKFYDAKIVSESNMLGTEDLMVSPMFAYQGGERIVDAINGHTQGGVSMDEERLTKIKELFSQKTLAKDATPTILGISVQVIIAPELETAVQKWIKKQESRRMVDSGR